MYRRHGEFKGGIRGTKNDKECKGGIRSVKEAKGA